MKSSNQEKIRNAFTQQAAGFESSKMNFSNQAYLDYAVSRIAPAKTDHVLEVAAGTCACGRVIAPHVQCVTCLDMTPAMLTVGKAKAEQEKLCNMNFVLGDAAELPFLNDSFDIVLSRLAFHHFPDVKRAFDEMARVLKPGGKLVLIDMEAAEEDLRKTEDEIEKLRDPSHVRNLSQAEMLALYETHGFAVSCCEVVRMPMVLQNWLDHTQTPPEIQAQIRAKMQSDISGGSKTGFAPYDCDGEIRFDHRWVLIVGTTKSQTGSGSES